MATYTEHNVTANGINIHYYRSTPPGGAPPIVMIHGLTDNGLCWVRVADALCDSFDIILPDTRGHGLSDKPASGYTVEERAADVAALIDALGLERPALFGHSLGGQVANVIAALYPDKVRALVLEDPAWFGDQPQENRVRQADEWCEGLRNNQRLGRAGLIEHCRQENPGWHEDELGPWADAKLQMSENALRQILLSMRPGWQDFLRQVRCPVLLVTGDVERGIIITPELYREAAALNPLVREAHIPNAGHCIHRDQFEPYMRAVKAFLKQVF